MAPSPVPGSGPPRTSPPEAGAPARAPRPTGTLAPAAEGERRGLRDEPRPRRYGEGRFLLLPPPVPVRGRAAALASPWFPLTAEATAGSARPGLSRRWEPAGAAPGASAEEERAGEKGEKGEPFCPSLPAASSAAHQPDAAPTYVTPSRRLPAGARPARCRPFRSSSKMAASHSARHLSSAHRPLGTRLLPSRLLFPSSSSPPLGLTAERRAVDRTRSAPRPRPLCGPPFWSGGG